MAARRECMRHAHGARASVHGGTYTCMDGERPLDFFWGRVRESRYGKSTHWNGGTSENDNAGATVTNH